MGQVPKITYGLVGSGRMAQHFGEYLRLLALPFQQGSRQRPAPLGGVDVILLLVKDSAIESVARDILGDPLLRSKPMIHFSGSLRTPLAQGFHPLLTFGDALYGLDDYRSMHFVCEKGALTF